MQPENSVLVNRLIDTQENNNNNNHNHNDNDNDNDNNNNSNNNNKNNSNSNNNNNNMFWVHPSITHPMNPIIIVLYQFPIVGLHDQWSGNESPKVTGGTGGGPGLLTY